MSDTVFYIGRSAAEIHRLLREPFRWAELEHRQQGKPSAKGNIQLLTYVRRKAIIDRLDHAVGFESWSDSYEVWTGGSSAKCKLSLYIDGRWVSKEDGADETDIEAVKGGITNAFKRAASKWGVGLYLYDMPTVWLKGEESNGKTYAPRDADRQIFDRVRKEAPELLHPDDLEPKARHVVTNTSTSEKVDRKTGEVVSPPQQQPQLIKQDFEPPWLDEEMSDGRFAGTRWRWFTEPSQEGGRIGYLVHHMQKETPDEWSIRATLCYLYRCTKNWYGGTLRNGNNVLSLDVINLCKEKGLTP